MLSGVRKIRGGFAAGIKTFPLRNSGNPGEFQKMQVNWVADHEYGLGCFVLLYHIYQDMPTFTRKWRLLAVY
jgi:hypothetical protein